MHVSERVLLLAVHNAASCVTCTFLPRARSDDHDGINRQQHIQVWAFFCTPTPDDVWLVRDTTVSMQVKDATMHVGATTAAKPVHAPVIAKVDPFLAPALESVPAPTQAEQTWPGDDAPPLAATIPEPKLTAAQQKAATRAKAKAAAAALKAEAAAAATGAAVDTAEAHSKAAKDEDSIASMATAKNPTDVPARSDQTSTPAAAAVAANASEDPAEAPRAAAAGDQMPPVTGPSAPAAPAAPKRVKLELKPQKKTSTAGSSAATAAGDAQREAPQEALSLDDRIKRALERHKRR